MGLGCVANTVKLCVWTCRASTVELFLSEGGLFLWEIQSKSVALGEHVSWSFELVELPYTTRRSISSVFWTLGDLTFAVPLQCAIMHHWCSVNKKDIVLAIGAIE